MHDGLVRPPIGSAHDEGDVGRRAAHVEGDQVLDADLAADCLRGDDACRGARQHRAHGQVRGLLQTDDAAIGLRQVRSNGDSEIAGAIRKAADVGLHDRAQIGVHHGRRHALELTKLGRHLVAGRDEGLRKLLAHDAAGHFLMLGAHEAVEEADDDRLHPRRLQLPGGEPQGFLVEGGLDGSVVPQPLRDLEAQFARDQHRRLIGLHVVELGALLAADLQEVAEAIGGDEPGRRAAVLDQCVGRNRGAVSEVADVGRTGADALDRLGDALRDAAGRVVRRGRDLPDLDMPRILVKQAHVGERASGIDTHAPGHRRHPFSELLMRLRAARSRAPVACAPHAHKVRARHPPRVLDA